MEAEAAFWCALAAIVIGLLVLLDRVLQRWFPDPDTVSLERWKERQERLKRADHG